MHIPDGLLNTSVAAVSAGLAGAGVAIATRNAKRQLHPRQVPLMGVVAAFIFAAQMINFPVLAGTSGHLVGSVLAVVLLGPGAAVIVMTAVLVVQAFLFADGGLLALGANVLNMAIVAPVGGYLVIAVASRLIKGDAGTLAAAGLGAWCSIVLAAMCCAGELAWSGTAPWGAVFPAMALVHMAIGTGEALATILVLAAIMSTRRELLQPPQETGRRPSGLPYALLLIAGLLIFIVPFASPWPDGLESVAHRLGFDQRVLDAPGTFPLAEYRFPGIVSAPVATSLAGLVGAVVVFGLSFIVARIVKPGPSR